MIIEHGRHIYRDIHEARKVRGLLFLDCAFRALIG